METTKEKDWKHSSNPVKEMLWNEYYELNESKQ